MRHRLIRTLAPGLAMLVLHLAWAPCAVAQPSTGAASAYSAKEWVMLGEALHGGFGTHIAAGIRIGEDALRVLKSQRRDVDVVVTEGGNAPCACIADGVALATAASPGQRSLTVLPKSQDASFLALIEVRSRRSGEAAVYRIPDSAMEPLANMNPGTPAEGRFDRVMAMPAPQLYSMTLQPRKAVP
jgi:hypothetical protein